MKRPALFGVEEETVLVGPRGVPEQAALTALFEALEEGASARVPAEDVAFSATLSTRAGAAVVNNDFCTHLLEVAWPPCADPAELAAIHEDGWATIGTALRAADLSVVPSGTLRSVPAETALRRKAEDEGGRRLRALVDRPLPKAPLAHPLAFTIMAATQVHLPRFDDGWFAALPFAYALEYLVTKAFGEKDRTCLGVRATCVRPLLYRDGFVPEYELAGVPSTIPTSKDEYAALVARSRGFLRDYSFLAPREERFEARSACSQPSVEHTLAVVALHLAIDRVARRRASIDRLSAADHRAPDGRAIADAYYRYCDDGTLPETFARDVDAVADARSEIAEPFQKHLDDALERLTGAPAGAASIGLVVRPLELGRTLRLRFDAAAHVREADASAFAIERDADETAADVFAARDELGDIVGVARFTPFARRPFGDAAAYPWDALARHLGCSEAELRRRSARIDKISVAPAHRRKGVATKLLDAIVAHAKTDGADVLVARAGADDVAGRRALVRGGFRSAGAVRTFGGAGSEPFVRVI